MAMRYVRFTKKGFVFSQEGFGGNRMTHEELAIAINDQVKSAGFVRNGPDGITCYGTSVSLGIDSLPEDTDLVRRILC